MTVALRCRPIDQWPGELGRDRQWSSPFSATWSATVDLLRREAEHLGAHELVLQLAVRESDLRLDGWLRANAHPSHPGVIIQLEGRAGPLRFSTDRFRNWQDNVRAIALALESLRRVDRYGIGTGTEQYAGWRAIGSGTPMGPAKMTAEQAERMLGLPGPPHSYSPAAVRLAYRELAKGAHPDAGGDPERFRQLTEARDLLLELWA